MNPIENLAELAALCQNPKWAERLTAVERKSLREAADTTIKSLTERGGVNFSTLHGFLFGATLQAAFGHISSPFTQVARAIGFDDPKVPSAEWQVFYIASLIASDLLEGRIEA